MGDVRDADIIEAGRLAAIAAAGFYDDPVMAWVMPDDATRLNLLTIAFKGLAHAFLPDRGLVQVLDDACVTFWRLPTFDYSDGRHDVVDGVARDPESPFPADVTERFAILDGLMSAVHPHDAHWYLNVISTLPDRQGEGLGSRILEPVLRTCDIEGIPAYLESSNPRNMSLYQRNGFEQAGEIPLPDGPSLYPMWRKAR